MNEKPTNYNLLVEQWIPILMTDGKYARVGIRDALTQAGRIRQIAASNPMDRVAILRFLLALLYWCKGNPPDEGRAVSGDSFPADWFSRLDDSRDCFNLLGEGKRFYQYRKAGSGKDGKLSANYLVQEVPTGTNHWHFRHSRDRADGLCQACCALGLLRLPLFATSGGRGKPPGVNSKPPIYVIPVGSSLAETLRLSWRQVSDFGTPAWEKPDMQLPRTGGVPLLMGLTWLPRRVWLDAPEGPETACVSCGRMEHLIALSVFAPLGSTKTDEGGLGRIWRDPHVLYATSATGEVTSLRASNALSASDAAAGQWAKIIVEMLRDQKATNPLRQTIHGSVAEGAKVHAWVVGFSTVQNDKYLEVKECFIPFPDSISNEGIPERIGEFDRWLKEGKGLVGRVKPPNKLASSRKHVETRPMVAAIRPHVESRASARAIELMAGGDDAWDRAAQEYRPMMEMIAQSLSPGFTAAAVQRRQQIARVTPDMRPRTGANDKPGRKKGGEK